MSMTPLPTPPTPGDTPAVFNTNSFALVAALPVFVSDANALQADVIARQADVASKQGIASAAATTATTKAGDALASANAAAGSAGTATTQAASVLAMDKRYLGAFAVAPTLDNQGAALLTGANYYDTTLSKIRAWSGSAWVDGISGSAGVSSFNGLTGAVNMPVGIAQRRAFFSASGTHVIPAGVTSIRGYTFGAGAAGTTTASGGGGGCAYGDIAVAAGDTVTVTISAGVCTMTTSAIVRLTGNPASGVTAGTASIHASVTNGGAYSGGAGLSSALRGGASSGSPLGAGVASSNAGGSGWGGAGTGGSSSGGGGVGGAGISSMSGPGLPDFSVITEPLLVGLTGRAVLTTALSVSQAGAPGAGGGGSSTAATGGTGGFGGGGGAATSNTGGAGGFGGGGAGGSTPGVGGAGGYGGGGGSGNGSAGGAGGGAAAFIYY